MAPTGDMCNSGIGTMIAGAALVAFRHVKPDSSGNAVYAGAGENGVGVTMQPAASGEAVPVKYWNSSGTFRVSMASSCSAGDALYSAASGQISTTSSGTTRLLAMEASSGSGSEIEVARI